MAKERKPIQCRFCGESGFEGDILSGLCPVGRGGVHEIGPPPRDLLGDPVQQPREPSPTASLAGRMLRAQRRDALVAGRKRGAKAAEHADAVSSDWTERASALTIEYGVASKGREFLIEEARTYAEGRGLPPPPDKRAWGGVSSRLSRRSQLVRVRFDTDGYGSPKSVWRVA